jgi:hypothetical protein
MDLCVRRTVGWRVSAKQTELVLDALGATAHSNEEYAVSSPSFVLERQYQAEMPIVVGVAEAAGAKFMLLLTRAAATASSPG